MPKLPKFDTPAFQNDFIAGEEAEKQAFEALWNESIYRFTEQTRQNNPWSATNQPALTNYYNPVETDVPADAAIAPIRWTAFPRRIQTSFPGVGPRVQWQYADEGPPSSPSAPYHPAGPRGWQDEYCEWSVTRNEAGRITKVSFTCENREYYFALWSVSPDAVLRVYQTVVGPDVKLEDLYQRDAQGQPVIDPGTNRPAYDDRNVWNSTTKNGAVHLISNPNALSAEIFLAGQATILREDGNGTPITEKNQLINCSHYGTANRNSDPTIGSDVNNLVRGDGQAPGADVSLHNPVGLYIQSPTFSRFSLPLGESGTAADFWTVTRGRIRQDGESIDMILHAVFEVPEERGFIVGDISIDGNAIDYGSQITETFQIALAGQAIAQTTKPTSLTCAGDANPPLPRAQVFSYLANINSANRGNVVLQIAPGGTAEEVVLVCGAADPKATIEISGDGVTLQTTRPVQSAGGGSLAFFYTVKVAAGAAPGDRSILVTNPDGSAGPPAYGLLSIVSAQSPTESARLTVAQPESLAAPMNHVAMMGHLKKLAELEEGSR